MKHTYILDGSYFLHHSLWRDKEREGKLLTKEMAVSALHTIHGIVNSRSPTEVYVVWDYGRSSKRLAMLPTYKKVESREKTDEERQLFRLYSELLAKILAKLCCKNVLVRGHEADDLIYEVVRKTTGYRTVVSEDRDFVQLVEDPSVSMYLPRTGKLINTLLFGDFFPGISPNQFLLYKSLVGDKSDAIAGVRGVGEVTAQKVLVESSATTPASLMSYLAVLPTLPSKYRAILSEQDIVFRNFVLMNLGFGLTDEARCEVDRVVLSPALYDPTVEKDLVDLGATMAAITLPLWGIPFRRMENGK